MVHSPWLSVVTYDALVWKERYALLPVVRSIVGKIDIDEEIFDPKEIDSVEILLDSRSQKSASKLLLSLIGTPNL